MKNEVKASLATLALLLVPALALAHPGHGAGAGDLVHSEAGFIDGLIHPFTGVDHLAAMVAVGVWSALAIRPVWLAPAAFVALLVGGAAAGFMGVLVPGVEPMIAASLLVLGLLVAWQRRMPVALAAGLTGAFAFFHGAAHGMELAGGTQWQALAGMVTATATLHAAGIAIGHLVLTRHRGLSLAAGACTALLGITLLARLA